MADRTMVRQGPVVSISAIAALLLISLGSGPDGSSSATTKDKDQSATAAPSKSATAKTAVVPPEKKPYKIKAWLAVDSHARVDVRGRETLIAGWKMMVKRFVGAPWELEIAEGDGPLATNELEAVTPEMVIPQAKGFDKAWLFRVESTDDGFSFAGREFDSATAQIGLLCRRPALVLADGPRALLQLSLDVFAASSEIAPAEKGDPKHRKLRVQGALVPAATPIGQVVSVGSVFRPSRIFYKPEGGILRLDVINSTYLQVEKIENGVATCLVVSALGNPLTDKVVGTQKMVGVGLKPAWLPTRVRFTFLNNESESAPGTKAAERPASGYTVTATPALSGTPREVATTDRDGRIYLEPGFAEGLVWLRLLAAGTEPLIEFPVMPGEMLGEKLMEHIDPRTRAVTAESDLYAIRDEVVDLIAVRFRLESRMKSRADAQNWAELKLLLDEFKTLPSKESIEARVNKIDEDLSADAKKYPRSRIRTKTVLSLLNDTKGLVDRYLDDEFYRAYAAGYEESQQQAANSKNIAKALPKMPTIGPKASSAGGVSSGPLDFSPAGSGFSVLMPGAPTESLLKTKDGATDVKSYKIAVPGKGVFTVAYWDYPVAIGAEKVTEVLDNERDRLVSLLPGGKISRESPMSVAGRDGREIEIAGPPARNGDIPVVVARIALSNSRVISVSVGGTKALVAAAASTDYLGSLKITARGGQNTAAANPPATNPPASTPKAAADPPASTSAGAKAAIDNAQKKANPPAKTGGGGATPF